MKTKNNKKTKGVFTTQCPNCKAKDKLVLHCKHCFIPCCSECSITVPIDKLFCMDCYLKLRYDYECSIYNQEKYTEILT